MPKVIDNAPPLGGYGCTCPSFRQRVAPQYLAMTIVRASDVTVERHKGSITGIIPWKAWTNPENVYHVTYDPNATGGWCKHCTACAADLAGGQLRESFIQVKEMLDECQKNERTMKQLQRKVTSLERKLEITKSPTRATAI